MALDWPIGERRLRWFPLTAQIGLMQEFVVLIVRMRALGSMFVCLFEFVCLFMNIEGSISARESSKIMQQHLQH